jgi:hypothetical protein
VRTASRLLVAPLVLALLVPSCAACSPGPSDGSKSIPPPTTTPVPADLSITVPRGNAADIDGTLRPSDWANARKMALVPEGELLLMHDGQYLYLGLRGKPDSVGSLCIAQGGQIAVLHSSLRVGTAVYKPATESWQRIQDSRWTWWDESDAQVALSQEIEFLKVNGWIASTMGSGSPGEMEYKIALPEGDVRLAVLYGSTEQMAWWPAQLADSCRQAALIQGRVAVTQRFQPAQWVSITVLSGN